MILTHQQRAASQLREYFRQMMQVFHVADSNCVQCKLISQRKATLIGQMSTAYRTGSQALGLCAALAVKLGSLVLAFS